MNAVRGAAWTFGAPARAVLVGGIRLYRATLSGWLGGQCRFHPSCSFYGEDAIREHGAIRGSAMAAWRIMRCNPFGAGGIDPVRPGRAHYTSHDEYDGVLRSAPRPGEEAHA
jgi:putative membrane protein insertion efficiency factor